MSLTSTLVSVHSGFIDRVNNREPEPDRQRQDGKIDKTRCSDGPGIRLHRHPVRNRNRRRCQNQRWKLWRERRRRGCSRRGLSRSASLRTPSRGTRQARDLPSRVSRPLSPNLAGLIRRLPYLPMLALLAATALVGYRPLPGPSLHYARHCPSLSLDEQTQAFWLVALSRDSYFSEVRAPINDRRPAVSSCYLKILSRLLYTKH